MKPLLVVLALAIAGIVYLLWELVGKHVKADRLEHLVHHEDTPMHTDRLIGRVGQVVSTVTRVSGQIEIDGELWEARLAVQTNDIPEHSSIHVTAFEGTCLLVAVHVD
jgi:membrane protein implicated in regulation of membrane protease activity